MKPPDVYLHGMTLLSHIHRLKHGHPEPDGYGEIEESWVVPGGEAANAAILLAGFGLSVRLDGPHLGTRTRDVLLAALKPLGVDTSGLVMDPGYGGVEDLVLVGGGTRTVLGQFGRYFSDDTQRWSPPDRQALMAAKVVAVDPYFGEASLQAAAWCLEGGKPMVTLDCPPDSPLHRAAAYTVISREFLRGQFPGADPGTLLLVYAQANQGWTVFTAGGGDIRYARHDQAPRSCSAFRVQVKGTLGAGDAFRAGLVFGLHQGWDADRSVRFAAATAARVCENFPVAANPPSLADIQALAAAPLD